MDRAQGKSAAGPVGQLLEEEQLATVEHYVDCFLARRSHEFLHCCFDSSPQRHSVHFLMIFKPSPNTRLTKSRETFSSTEKDYKDTKNVIVTSKLAIARFHNILHTSNDLGMFGRLVSRNSEKSCNEENNFQLHFHTAEQPAAASDPSTEPEKLRF